MRREPTDRVLAGRRVVVTRAAGQTDELTALLRTHGAEPVVVSLVDTVVDEAGAAELAALDPERFDWLVVTSPNAARHYRQVHGDCMPPNVAAVGAATAAILGDRTTLVPARQNAIGLLDEFPATTGRLLLVHAAAAEPTLREGLTARGAQVTAVAPYRTVPVHPSAGVQLAALAADAVLFAAGSAARAWVDVFGTNAPPVVVVIGPQTAAAATAAGLKVTLVAADHSLEGLVEALVADFAPPQ